MDAVGRHIQRTEQFGARQAFQRLNSLFPLGSNDLPLFDRLAGSIMHRPGAELATEGAAPSPPRIVLAGWVARQRLLPDGRRQIFGFVLPGDAIGLCSRSRPLALTTLVALTAVRALDATPIRTALPNSPALSEALARAAALDEAMLLDHVVRLGRQTAYERVAHLLLELHQRLTVVGLQRDGRFPMPLTQEALADTLGLSIVHTNRTLQQLRRDRLIEMKSGETRLLDIDALARIADYKPVRVTS